MSDELKAMEDLNNLDLSTVETDFPLLDSGIVSLQVQECEIKKDEEKADAYPYVHIKVALTAPHRTTGAAGRTVKTVSPGDRGSTLTHRIYFGTSYKKKEEGTKFGYDAIAKFRESVFGKAKPGDRFNPAEMLGQDLTARLAFEESPSDKNGKTYSPRTSIADFVRKAR